MTIPLNPCPYKIGDQVKFKPSAYGDSTTGFGGELNVEVAGKVVQINEPHHWYRAAYEPPQGTRYETFKF